MKKNVLVTILMALGLLLTSCNNNSGGNVSPADPVDPVVDPVDPVDPVVDPVETTVLVESISFAESSVSIDINESKQLAYSILPTNATNKNVTWKTSDSTVASINNGFVKGLKAGNAVITVTTVDGNHTDTINVIVNQVSNVESIAVDRLASDINALTFYYNETFSSNGLVVNATYNDGKPTANVVSECKFENTDIIYDEETGGKYVTVTHIPSGKTCTYWISITIPYEENVAVTSIKIDDISMSVGEKKTITATVKPSETYWKAITWSISDSSIATIDSTTGEINALKAGVATITAKSKKYPSKEGTCLLTVADGPRDHGTLKTNEIINLANALPKNDGAIFVNSQQIVTLKCRALDILPFVSTGENEGGNSKPTKVLVADENGYIMAASGTGANDFADKTKDYLNKSYYTITGTVAMYRGVPEIQVTSFTWTDVKLVDYDVNALSEEIATATAMANYAKTLNVNTKGMASGKLIKTTATCIYQIDKNGSSNSSYLFRDKEGNTFNVYQPFGASLSKGKEYDLAGLLTMYNHRMSLRAITYSLTGNTPSEFNIEDHALNTTISALYDIKEPSGATIDENYMLSNSKIYSSEVYVGFYSENSGANNYYVVGDNYKTTSKAGEYTVATSKTNAVTNKAVWLSNEQYWNFDLNYIAKGKLYQYCLDTYQDLTTEDLDDFKLKIYYTLNLVRTDTGVANTTAWKISIIEDLIPNFGIDPQSTKDTILLSDSTQYSKVGEYHTWTSGNATMKTTNRTVDTGYTVFNKDTTFNFSFTKAVSTIEINYYLNTYKILTGVFDDCIVNETNSGATVVLSFSEPLTSYKVTAENSNKIKIKNIVVYYANEE